MAEDVAHHFFAGLLLSLGPSLVSSLVVWFRIGGASISGHHRVYGESLQVAHSVFLCPNDSHLDTLVYYSSKQEPYNSNKLEKSGDDAIYACHSGCRLPTYNSNKHSDDAIYAFHSGCRLPTYNSNKQ